MSFVLHHWQPFFLILSGLVNRRQHEIIEFQNAQIRALMDKMGRGRILLTDEQRRVLATKGKAIGRKALMELTTIVTPDTILRWHRWLIAEKWDYSARRRKAPRRPPVPDEVARLVLRMAEENPTWGYDRIQGALANLGHEISDTTAGNILVAMRLKTRRVGIAGMNANPDGDWVRQMARNLTASGGFLAGASHVLVDRDTKVLPLRTYVEGMTDTDLVLLPARSPNLNVHLERYMRPMKSECLDRMIFFGR